MSAHRDLAVIANDLDSLVHRIEGGPAHPKLTDAVMNVMRARDEVRAAIDDLRRAEWHARHADVLKGMEGGNG